MTDTETQWFEVVAGSTLAQGDIIPECEVIKWQAEDVGTDQRIPATVEVTDVVILTQSCDLENDGKTEFVLLAELMNYDELVRAHPQEKYGKSFRAACARGRYVGLMLLPPHEGSPALAWSIVNFANVYTLPIAVVRRHAESVGARLRLRSPYREHLAQLFGRYFMRVALPDGLQAFDTYSPSSA